MRYNKHELYALASQTSQNFEREGVLIIKERQDGFFRRSEGSSVRWFRLRGNLLFYLKGPEPWYEPLGVIVLGNHQVSVQTQDENGHWPFHIVWENGVSYRIATFLESERTLWLKAMEFAPYEHMTHRIIHLHQQLKDTRTVIDLKSYRITNKIINGPGSGSRLVISKSLRRPKSYVTRVRSPSAYEFGDFNEVPLCELSLSCDNLLCDSHGKPPSPFASVFLLFPEKDLSVRYCSTEIVLRSSNPTFSRTVMFRGSDGITSDVLVRIAVYNIHELVTNTGVTIGSVTMRLSHIQEAQRLRIPLLTMDDKIVGFITLNGWSLERSHEGASPTHSNNERNSIDLTPKILCHRRSQSLPPRLGLKLKYPSYGILIRQNFMNPHQSTYRFHSGLGGEITVHEAIAEPRFCFTVPLQLVEIYMCRENDILEAMLAFVELTKRVPPCHLELLSTHLSVMKLFQATKKVMTKYTECYTHISTEEEADLEFVPVNLHLQRMWVHNDTLNKTGFHDVITVGAFTAHTYQTDRPGGLINLVQQSKNTSTNKAEKMSNTNRLDADFEKLDTIKAIRNVTVVNMDKTLLLMQAGRFEDAKKVVEDIKYNVANILSLWDVNSVEEALSRIGWDKKRIDDEAETVRIAEQLAMQVKQADTPEGAAGAAVPEGAAGASAIQAVASVIVISNAAAVAAMAGARTVAELEGARANTVTEGVGAVEVEGARAVTEECAGAVEIEGARAVAGSVRPIRILPEAKGAEPVSGESDLVIDGAQAVAASEGARANTLSEGAEAVKEEVAGAIRTIRILPVPKSPVPSSVLTGVEAVAELDRARAGAIRAIRKLPVPKGSQPVFVLKDANVITGTAMVSPLEGNSASTSEGAAVIDGAEAAVAVEGAAGVPAPKTPEPVSELDDAHVFDGVAMVSALEGSRAVSLPGAFGVVSSPEVAGDIFPPEVIGVAPLGVAGASAPEGASSINTNKAPPKYTAVGTATSSICIPKMSPALRSALEAAASEGAMAVLSQSFPSTSMELPSCSSSDSQVQQDHFKKDSESSENNGGSEQSGPSGNSTSSAKVEKKKPTRKGKCNRNIQNRIADSGRASRPGQAKPKVPPFVEKKTIAKQSKSTEQVASKSVANIKKADKKKGKKNRRIEPEVSPPEFVMDPVVRHYNLMFFCDVTKAIRDMLYNMELSVSAIATKDSYTESEFEDSKIYMDLLIKLMDEVHKWTRMAHIAMRVDTETPRWTLQQATLQCRRDTCFSQALTATTAGLMSWLSTERGEIVAKIIKSGLGPLCGFEGLVSLYALEKTMWGDMVVAVEDINTVIFKLVKLTSSVPVIPQVTGRRNAVIVELPVLESLYSRFDKCQDRPTFTVTAVLFNIGINEKAGVATALGEDRMQYYSNSDNLEKLNKYYHNYTKIFPTDPMEPIRASSRSKPLEEVMENLRSAVAKCAGQDTDVLQLAALATRQMHGIRITSCKSAKDRTSMSVTLEQTNILSSEYHLADHERQKALDVMRSEGCRRENALKNIGISRYAFTKKQVMSLPENYQPPKGSYGIVPT